ncbi:MAG: F0F1 ATP synthase subunit delta [Polyangiaceae bacterium]|nr:F0F1 ATP synthase subunit delta [Polyangiaceae bacterium]
MSYEAIARRYAQAVFELGKESGQLGAVLKQLTALAEVLSGSEELRAVLGNPLVDDASKEAILIEVSGRLGSNETATRALRVLAQNGRLMALPDIARVLARLADEDSRTLRATVTSAAALSDSYRSKLRAELEKVTGQKVEMVTRVDAGLIAGVVVQIGDRVIDGSARAKLQRFREGLTQN